MEAIFKLKNYKRLSINHIKLFIDNLLFQKIIPQAGRHDLYLNKGAVRIPFTKVAYLDMLEIFSKCIVNIYMTDTVIIFNGYDNYLSSNIYFLELVSMPYVRITSQWKRPFLWIWKKRGLLTSTRKTSTFHN